MRGYDNANGHKTSEFVWEAPDGSKVFAYYLPDGYSNGAWLNLLVDDQKKSSELVRKTLTKIHPWSLTPNMLLMNGTDHLTPVAEIPGMLKHFNKEFSDYRFIHSDLETFIEKANACNCWRPLLRGELRQNGENAPLLYGVLSTRVYLKQRNQIVQNLLEKWMEPACAAAWLMLSDPYPDKLIWQAWKYVLQNHPHDSICGCSIDPVHEQMLTRFAWAEDISEYSVERALEQIANRIKAY